MFKTGKNTGTGGGGGGGGGLAPSITCTNCGKLGHLFRECTSPITSFGIIAIHFDNQDIIHKNETLCSDNTHITGRDLIPKMKFLLIQRKDSLNFVEFVRGKYLPNDLSYLVSMIKNLTIAEQTKLLTMTFDELWRNVWGRSSRSHRNDYELSLGKYNQIAKLLPRLIEENPSKWDEPEWGFPKGRRNEYESDISCAMREFEEETNLGRDKFRILDNIMPVCETFFGSNHIHYCHKYYLAITNSFIKAEMAQNNPHMIREIGDIKWLTFDEALQKIRPDNIEKREILFNVVRIMRNYLPVGMNVFEGSAGGAAATIPVAKNEIIKTK
jgi:8-oxo-dGTP pyrophosphatase MutT (NUDIX family)